MFRLNWTIRLLRSKSIYRQLSEQLRTPLLFYLAILLKLVPLVYPPRIRLQFHDKNVIFVRDFMTLYIFKEIFLDNIYSLDATERSIDAIIDVGANTGLFVLWAKRNWPNAMIIAFEPEPHNFAELQNTVSFNKLSNVTLRNMALSAGCSEASALYIDRRNVGGHSMYHRRSSTMISVPTLSVETALDELPDGKRCDFLKIDCEGCELAIFRSLKPEVAARISTIAYETEGALYDVDEMNSHLESFGYKITHSSERLFFATQPTVADRSDRQREVR